MGPPSWTRTVARITRARRHVSRRPGASTQVELARQALSRCSAILGASYYAAKALPLEDVTRALRELNVAKDALRRTGG